jgi:hypothetical protein
MGDGSLRAAGLSDADRDSDGEAEAFALDGAVVIAAVLGGAVGDGAAEVDATADGGLGTGAGTEPAPYM